VNIPDPVVTIGENVFNGCSSLPGVTLSTTADNCLVIDAPHLCPQRLVTSDVVELEEAQGTQRFKVLGRIDNVINTGGVKVHIEQIEKVLAPHINKPFLITKCPDARFGEVVVMLLQGSDSDVEDARLACGQHLHKYARPKHIITVPTLPMTPTGKPARHTAAAIAESKVNS
jgi:O-succinylbenzoic acid--CoA ligase